MKRFLLVLIVLLLSTSGCSHDVVPVVPVNTAPLVLPENVGPIVVLVDHLPGEENLLL